MGEIKVTLLWLKGERKEEGGCSRVPKREEDGEREGGEGADAG